MRFFISGLLTCFVFLSSIVLAEARNPVGEKALYKLDRKRSRTSSLISRGTLALEFRSFHPEVGELGAFRGNLSYDLKVRFVGNQAGSQNFEVPYNFVQPEFLERLRVEKDMEIKNSFKVKHLGKGTVTNRDGGHYPNCDKILVYDINMNQANSIAQVLYETIGAVGKAVSNKVDNERIDIRDPEIVLHLSSKVPAGNAAKIDLKGIVRGFKVRAGFDYQR